MLVLAASIAIAEAGCQSVALVNTTLTGDMNCDGFGLWIQEQNTVVDCQGYTIRGNGTSFGINVTGTDTATIKKCIKKRNVIVQD